MAKQRYSAAQYNLACMHQGGFDANPPSEAKTAAWMGQYANLGNREAIIYELTQWRIGLLNRIISSPFSNICVQF